MNKYILYSLNIMNINSKYGFIITRHVNSELTNKYWNACIHSIRKYYSPRFYKIIVIDDNSDLKYVKAARNYENVEYIQSEYIGRGELLPFYYFYQRHFFDNAIIIHDSVFFQKKIAFHKIHEPVLPLWHFDIQKSENLSNSLRLIAGLNYYDKIADLLTEKNKYSVLTLNNDIWMGCFGCQCYINWDFLSIIQKKYNLFSLLRVVTNRADRCCLERIMGVIFFIEMSKLKIKRTFSIFGNITHYIKWGYTYEEYIRDQQCHKILQIPLIKIWTGR